MGQLLLLLLGRTPSSLTLLFAISAAATAVACGLSLALPSPRPRPTELVAAGSAGCSRASLLNAEVQAWPSVQCRAIASSTTLDVGVIATASYAADGTPSRGPRRRPATPVEGGGAGGAGGGGGGDLGGGGAAESGGGCGCQ